MKVLLLYNRLDMFTPLCNYYSVGEGGGGGDGGDGGGVILILFTRALQ